MSPAAATQDLGLQEEHHWEIEFTMNVSRGREEECHCPFGSVVVGTGAVSLGVHDKGTQSDQGGLGQKSLLQRFKDSHNRCCDGATGTSTVRHSRQQGPKRKWPNHPTPSHPGRYSQDETDGADPGGGRTAGIFPRQRNRAKQPPGSKPGLATSPPSVLKGCAFSGNTSPRQAPGNSHNHDACPRSARAAPRDSMLSPTGSWTPSARSRVSRPQKPRHWPSQTRSRRPRVTRASRRDAPSAEIPPPLPGIFQTSCRPFFRASSGRGDLRRPRRLPLPT
nr:rho GTPase-activating protein 17-like [Macaca nemestrina]